MIVAAICLAIIVIAIVLFALMVGNRPAPETREVNQTAMLVDTVTAEEARGPFMVEAQGTVQPVTQTRLAAEVSGTIVEISDDFVAGGFFEAGDVLARIDPSDYEAALLQAEAELASARARLADESARSDQARRDWERLHGSSRDPGDLVLRLPQVAEARAAVQAAEAGVLRARRNLDRTEIRLPYDGLVRARDVDLGQFVSPGTPLGVTFSVATAEVRLPLSNQDLAFLDLPSAGRSNDWKAPVRLRGEVAGQQGSWTGRIIRTEGVVDENTRLSYAVVEVDDPYNLESDRGGAPLQIGTFVEAVIEGRDASGLIILPRQALRQDDQLYLVDENGKLEIRPVEVIRSTTDRVYLQNAIKAGDPVITTAIQAPIPGLAVQIRETDGAEPELRVRPAAELAAGAEDPS
ncbi:MAG: efflux RND transporter periplasmic adaptor subunit [Wenzhouxiangella sp.]|jgi:RND family efflux transporter MFP subunit|nr:efflux RND transporter periplasmic adaptor subunit [Wenzhouxiangella sp.]